MDFSASFFAFQNILVISHFLSHKYPQNNPKAMY